MLDLQTILSKLDKLKNLPWKGFLWLLAGTFLTASAVSSIVGVIFIPKAEQFLKQKAPPEASDPLFKKESKSIGDEGIKAIVGRNIFNIDGKTGDDVEAEADADKKKGEEEYTGKETIKTTLPLKLQGTIYGGDPFSGIAIIEDTTKKVINSFFVGDTLVPGSKVVEIHRERVIFDRGSHREYIELEEKEVKPKRRKGGAPKKPEVAAPAGFATDAPPEKYSEEGFERAGTSIKVSSDFRNKLLTTDFAKVLQDAKAEPNFVNGELNGFRLTRIRQDSIYQKAGLMDGDVIKEINGVSLVDTAQAIKLLNSLRGEPEIEVRLERGSKSMNVTMQVK